MGSQPKTSTAVASHLQRRTAARKLATAGRQQQQQLQLHRWLQGSRTCSSISLATLQCISNTRSVQHISHHAPPAFLFVFCVLRSAFCVLCFVCEIVTASKADSLMSSVAGSDRWRGMKGDRITLLTPCACGVVLGCSNRMRCVPRCHRSTGPCCYRRC